MKRPGDGWVIINWHICPSCGKKGYYQKFGDIYGRNWYCKYCHFHGSAPEETKKGNCIVCKKREQISDKIRVCRKCFKILSPIINDALYNALTEYLNSSTLKEVMEFKVYADSIKNNSK
jgi:ribosomal protein S14